MRLRISVSVFLLLGVFTSPLRAETWRIASIEWPPYAGSTLKDGGLAIRDLQLLLNREGVELAVDYMPWTRALTVARSADYVGYFPAWPEEVQAGFAASNTISQSVVGAVMLAGASHDWSSLDDLFDHHRVGFVGSYVYPVEIQKQILEHYQVEDGAENEQDLARVLAAGRVDVAVTDPDVLQHVAAQLSITDKPFKVRVFHQHPLVMAFTMHPGFEKKRALLNRLLSPPGTMELCCHMPDSTDANSAN